MASAISKPHSNHSGFSRCFFAGQTLLPTPIRLRIATRKRQLLLITPIRQHRPDLLPTRSAGLKNNMPPIRRPRRKIISSAVVSQLHPLLAGRVHQVNIRCPRSTRPVMSSPGEHQKLPIGRPRRRYRITLVRNPLHIGAVRFHGVNLRQPAAPAYPCDLRPGLAIPHRRNIRSLERRNTLQISPRLIHNVNLRISRARRRKRQLRAIGGPRRRKIRAPILRE